MLKLNDHQAMSKEQPTELFFFTAPHLAVVRLAMRVECRDAAADLGALRTLELVRAAAAAGW